MKNDKNKRIAHLAAMLITGAIFAGSVEAQVVCDTFEIKSELKGTELTFHLETDLPADTSVSVSVSRSYKQAGEDSTFSVDYYSESATVSQLKEAKTIKLDNAKWQKDLDAKNAELSRTGLGFTLASVSPTVKLQMIVPMVQDNPAFGKHNSELTGKYLEKTGIRVVMADTSFQFAIDMDENTWKRQPSLHAYSLDVGQTYRVSKDTPLMPHHSPADPMAALKQAKSIPKGGGFKVVEVYKGKNIPWYKVAAFGSDRNATTAGWINSTALLGQELELME